MMGYTLAGGRVHRVGHHESALWDIVCVLASTLPPEQVIQLAIAKAMKP